MATIAVAGVGAYATALAGTGYGAVIVAVVAAAAAIGAAYIDQRYVYPALFGRDEPQTPQNMLGLDAMTGEDGAPGHKCWGIAAVVGGHVLFFEDVRTVTNRTTDKKTGAGSIFTKRTALVGIGWAHNQIERVEQIYADQRVFWRQDPDNVVWSDHRAVVTTASSPARLVITPTTSEAQDIGPVIFPAGAIVRVSRMPTGGPNGLWRVYASWPLGDNTYPFGRVELTTLQAATPAAGSAGYQEAPMEIRRMDSVLADAERAITSPTFSGLILRGSNNIGEIGCQMFCGGPDIQTYTRYMRNPADIFRAGMVVRLSGWGAPTGSGANLDGRWQIIASWATGTTAHPGIPNSVFLRLDELDAQNPNRTGWSTDISTGFPGYDPNNPPTVELAEEEGFLEPSANQEHQTYFGLETQGPDADLQAIFGAGAVHGYRGIARSTIRHLNISNFGDRVPQFSAVVRCGTQQSTHEVVRDIMRESYRTDDAYDLTDLPRKPLVGYTRRGIQSGTTTLQPVAIAYGIESQDIGGKWRLFNYSTAHVVQLLETELAAHDTTEKPPPAFAHQRVQDRDLPRQISLYYRDPLNDFTRTEKTQRTSSPEDMSGEQVAVDLDPLVMWPWDAQNAVNRIFAAAIVGRDQGSVCLGPSRMYLLPNDRLTFTALNWNEENVDIVAGAIAHTTAIKAIEIGSISIQVDFQVAGGCRLVDKESYPGSGVGVLIGNPESVVPVVNSINYATGVIQYQCALEVLRGLTSSGATTTTLNDTGRTWVSNEHAGRRILIMGPGWQYVVEQAIIASNSGTQLVFPAMSTAYGPGAHYMIAEDDSGADLLQGRVRYEFPNAWRMRIQSTTSRRNRIFKHALVAVAESFPVIGSPVETNRPLVFQASRPAALYTQVLDIPAVMQGMVENPAVFFAACPLRGNVWRGAGVYTSQDGISYALLSYIQQPTVMGTCAAALPDADVHVVDWKSSLSVTLEYGELADASFDQINSGFGDNWALVGNEVICFHKATLETDGSYTLTGLIRGRRDTADAMASHVAGERFVLLYRLGITELSGVFHEFPLPTDIGRTQWVKIVPTGGNVDLYPAVEVTWTAQNIRPFAPMEPLQGSLAVYGYSNSRAGYTPAPWLTTDVVIRWHRRSRAVAPAFGAGATAPLLEAIERYQVDVYRGLAVVRTVMVGGVNTGGPMVHRTFRYLLAQQIADGFASGDTASFVVRQVGLGGYSRPATITWTIP